MKNKTICDGCGEPLGYRFKNKTLCAICIDPEAVRCHHTNNCEGAGFSVGSVDSSGELPLYLEIGNVKGTVFLSQEMWQAIGEKAGWVIANDEQKR